MSEVRKQRMYSFRIVEPVDMDAKVLMAIKYEWEGDGSKPMPSDDVKGFQLTHDGWEEFDDAWGRRDLSKTPMLNGMQLADIEKVQKVLDDYRKNLMRSIMEDIRND